jgi:hypothetical protein
MGKLQFMVGALALLGAVGCKAGDEGSGSGERGGTSSARIVVSLQGSERALVEISAVGDATGQVTGRQAVDVVSDGLGLLEFELEAAPYTFRVEVYDEGRTRIIARGEVPARLEAGVVTEIAVVADGKAGDVTGSVNAAPQIRSIQAQLLPAEPIGDILGGRSAVRITVDAEDPEQGALRYYWSGFGIYGAVEGPSIMMISDETVTHAGPALVNVVVQDPAGATTGADIRFTGKAGCALCGGSIVHVNVLGAEAAEARACSAERQRCAARCVGTTSAEGTPDAAFGECISGCAMSQALCMAP